MINKFIVVGGCPRSGTTLLNILINTHPDIFISNELNIIKFNDKLNGLFYREDSSKKLKERKKSKKETWKLSDLTSLIPNKSITLYSELFKFIYQDMSNSSSLSLIGDKFPKYYHDFPNYQNLDFVKTKYYLHVSRNPINVLNSFIRRQKNTRDGVDYFNTSIMPEEILNEWICAWNFINKESSIHNIKYEDIITNRKKVIFRLSYYLDITDSFDTSLINDFDDEIILSRKEVSLLPPSLIEISRTWNDLDFSNIPNHLQKIETIKLSFKSLFNKVITRIL